MVDKIMLLFLPMILFLGIITSYEDIKKGKIRNKWVIAALVYAVLLYTLIGFYNYIKYSDNHFIIETLVNLLVSSVIGIFFWVNKYWSAADAKLFICFSFLVPITVYERGYVKYFPSINILIISFIIITIILLYWLIRDARLHYKNVLKKLRTDTSLFKMVLVVFIMHWCIRALFNFFNVQGNILLVLLSILVFSQILGSVIARFFIKDYYIIIPFVLLRLIFDRSIYSVSFIKEFMIIALLFIFIRSFVIRLSYEVFSEEIHIKSIKEGMMLNQVIVRDGKRYIKYDMEELQTLKGKPLLKYDNYDGLSVSDVKKIKTMYSRGLFKFNHIKVAKPTFFAPYLFIASILVIITQGGLLSTLKDFILGII